MEIEKASMLHIIIKEKLLKIGCSNKFFLGTFFKIHITVPESSTFLA